MNIRLERPEDYRVVEELTRFPKVWGRGEKQRILCIFVDKYRQL